MRFSKFILFWEAISETIKLINVYDTYTKWGFMVIRFILKEIHIYRIEKKKIVRNREKLGAIW